MELPPMTLNSCCDELLAESKVYLLERASPWSHNEIDEMSPRRSFADSA